MNEATINHDAQDDVRAALELTMQVNQPGRGLIVPTETGVLSKGYATTEDKTTDIEYHDHSPNFKGKDDNGELVPRTEPSMERSTRVDTTTDQGNYIAGIQTSRKPERAHAWAGGHRNGYGNINFGSKENEAAALITSLAAKKIGKEAIAAIDKLNDAKDSYVNRKNN